MKRIAGWKCPKAASLLQSYPNDHWVNPYSHRRHIKYLRGLTLHTTAHIGKYIPERPERARLCMCVCDSRYLICEWWWINERIRDWKYKSLNIPIGQDCFVTSCLQIDDHSLSLFVTWVSSNTRSKRCSVKNISRVSDKTIFPPLILIAFLRLEKGRSCVIALT